MIWFFKQTHLTITVKPNQKEVHIVEGELSSKHLQDTLLAQRAVYFLKPRVPCLVNHVQ